MRMTRDCVKKKRQRILIEIGPKNWQQKTVKKKWRLGGRLAAEKTLYTKKAKEKRRKNAGSLPS